MKNIMDLITEARKHMNDYSCDFVADYYNSGSSYISDAIMEFADNQTSIYYADIIKFISENVERVNDTIKEFGWDGCGEDLYKAGQMAEFSYIEELIYEDSEDLVTLSVLYLLKDHGIVAADNDLLNDWINEVTARIDSNDGFDDLEDVVNELLEEYAESIEDDPERKELIMYAA